jgi:NAD(P)-dependent dehydrogenase (short-subunit alcohol dehydrogenase family)
MSAGPVIIVTGAAGGIGTETVRTLLKECGAKVVATDVVMGKLSTLKAEHPLDLETFIGDIVAVRIQTSLLRQRF